AGARQAQGGGQWRARLAGAQGAARRAGQRGRRRLAAGVRRADPARLGEVGRGGQALRREDRLKRIPAGALDVAYEESGAADGTPVILLHGFPYDIHAYAEVAPRLAAAGCRVITPFLRGYGQTRFLSATALR